MKYYTFLLLTSLFTAGCLQVPSTPESASEPGNYLENINQLTFGGQNAEGYWSPDGTKLVFQSTRNAASCDQIYVMNADGSDQKMISTGDGVTTCGYFLPDGESILYASTHLAGKECPPRPDRSQGYVWPVHAGYDLFLTDLEGSGPTRLTTAEGYDAEGTINWAKGKIIYTSKLSGDLDLWAMDLDGTHKTQLTKSFGYEGGAFFSPDGNKLVLRANQPAAGPDSEKYQQLLDQNLTAPMKMELFLADTDGGNMLQLTDFGCASFAPQFTPDGGDIIFASNRNNCDSREFELFLIGLDGSNLRQVTDFGGFTSFPEFSPDGTQLAFTSDRDAKSRYEFNIYIAQWIGSGQ